MSLLGCGTLVTDKGSWEITYKVGKHLTFAHSELWDQIALNATTATSAATAATAASAPSVPPPPPSLPSSSSFSLLLLPPTPPLSSFQMLLPTGYSHYLEMANLSSSEVPLSKARYLELNSSSARKTLSPNISV